MSTATMMMPLLVNIVNTACIVISGLLVLTVLAVVFCRARAHRLRSRQEQPQQHPGKNHDKKVLAFFHPHCSGGGGGERVLWKAIQVLGTMMHEYPCLAGHFLIYTVDPPSPQYAQKVLQDVQDRFSIVLSDKLKIRFVHLHEYKPLLDPSPRLSLLVESLGAMRLAWHALQKSQNELGMLPHVFIDTTGCAFTFCPASLYYGCNVLAYVHYPTISTDMLQMVWERRRAAYNHAPAIAESRVQTTVKLVYYCAFAVLYGLVGSLATTVMVNSTWTYNHVQFLWKGPAWRRAIRIVYPPCAVTDLQSIGNDGNNDKDAKQRSPTIISIGQFRPEKDHVLQIEAFARLLHQEASSSIIQTKAKLVLIGSCRHADDEVRLQHLKQLVQELGLQEKVEFCVNQPYSTIRHWLGQASVGIHTMWNEHFGIGIVEMMAAGLIVVAHNSGGPQTDIIHDAQTGFLATTVDQYAVALHQALTMPAAQAAHMRRAARQSAQRFSDEVFAQSFRDTIVQAKIL